mmetsp:Transcript_75595/g.179641  ORF Transcript_75595/g.179641 Transcript_75595/m.179641 type:complete len:395 (+) Transcript_75595:78-1262(+)
MLVFATVGGAPALPSARVGLAQAGLETARPRGTAVAALRGQARDEAKSGDDDGTFVRTLSHRIGGAVCLAGGIMHWYASRGAANGKRQRRVRSVLAAGTAVSERLLTSPITGAEVETVEVRVHPQFADKMIVEDVQDGFQWTHPVPTLPELQQLYSEDYNSMFGRDFSEGAPVPEFSTRRAKAQAQFLLDNAADLSQVKRVAEAGAGWGELSLALKEALPKVESARCFELDGAAVGHMKHRGIDATEGTLEGAEDVASESLDLIASSHVVEHLPEPRLILAKWHELLAPGGLLFTEIPLENPVPNWWGADPENPYWVGHLYFYGREHFQAMLQSLGFEIIAATPHDHTVSPGYVMPGSSEPYDVTTVDPLLDTAISDSEFPKVLRVLARKPANK